MRDFPEQYARSLRDIRDIRDIGSEEQVQLIGMPGVSSTGSHRHPGYPAEYVRTIRDVT